MFERHFGLRENPFAAGHQQRFVYPSPEHLEALAHLRYGIENREPFILISGEVGTGKTTALYDALSEWESRVVVALITNSALTRNELLEEIALRFGVVVSPGSSKPQVMTALERHLLAVRARQHRAILLLDEAQNLDRELLEEIRLLSNLESGGDHLLQVVLVGQPELEEKLGRPELRQLRQRITVHYRIGPLSPEDSERYIHHRVSVAGGHALTIFPADACRMVHQLTGGIPREINHLAAQAMLTAFVEDSPTVRVEHVQSAASEIEFKSVLQRSGGTTESHPGPAAMPSTTEATPMAPAPAAMPPAPAAREPRVASATPASPPTPPPREPRSEFAVPPVPPPPAPPARERWFEPAMPPSPPARESWIEPVGAMPPAPPPPPPPPADVEPAPVTPPAASEPQARAPEAPPPAADSRDAWLSALASAAKPRPTEERITPAPPSEPEPRVTHEIGKVEVRSEHEPRPLEVPAPTPSATQRAARPAVRPSAAPPARAPEPVGPEAGAERREPVTVDATPAPKVAPRSLDEDQRNAARTAHLPPRLREKLERVDEAGDEGDGGSRSPMPWLLGAAAVAAVVIAVVLWIRFRPGATPAGVAGTTGAARVESARTAPPESASAAAPSTAAPATPGPATTPPAAARTLHASAPSPAAPAQAPVATTPPPATEPGTEPAAPAPATAQHFGVVVRTFLVQDRAEAERVRLSAAAGLPARILTAQEDGTEVYRIVLGSWDDRVAAERGASDLIRRGLVDEARVVALGRSQ